MNNDDFTLLVSGGSRCCWVSMCTVWPSHSKWQSKQNDESASNLVLGLNISPQKVFGWVRPSWMVQCAQGKYKCGTTASMMVENLLEVIHILEGLQQEHRQCWKCMGCSQQRLVTASVRTRSWCEVSKNFCVQDFDAGSWHETCPGKIHSTTSATRAAGTSCCSC